MREYTLEINIGKYVKKIFRLNGSHRFLCTKNPIIPSKRTANTRSLVSIPTYFYSDTYPYSISFLINNIRSSSFP